MLECLRFIRYTQKRQDCRYSKAYQAHVDAPYHYQKHHGRNTCQGQQLLVVKGGNFFSSALCLRLQLVTAKQDIHYHGINSRRQNTIEQKLLFDAGQAKLRTQIDADNTGSRQR